MSQVVEHFGANIQQPCALSVLRRVTHPEDGSPGPYAPLATHVTPQEHTDLTPDQRRSHA